MKKTLKIMQGKSNEEVDPDLLGPSIVETETNDQDQLNESRADGDQRKEDAEGDRESECDQCIQSQTNDEQKEVQQLVEVYENDDQKVITTVTSFEKDKTFLEKDGKEKEKVEKKEEEDPFDEASSDILSQRYNPNKDYVKMLRQSNSKKRKRHPKKTVYSFSKAKKIRKQRKKQKSVR